MKPNKMLVSFIHPKFDGNLTQNDFAVEIGGKSANIVTFQNVPFMRLYRLEVMPPVQPTSGSYALTVTAGSDSATEPEAIQYTDTNNVDVALVIDRSGSMGDPSSDPSVTKMEAAKNAANMFVDFMVNGDMIGVVSFREYATVNYGLTTIAGTVKPDVQNAIQAISSDGRTSIGDGLQYGQNELTAKGDIAHPWAIVLLSDGLENEPAWVADVLPGIKATKTVVHTIGFGGDADEALMLDIASQTDGTYHFEPSGSPEVLAGIYRTISGAITGQQTLASFTGTAQQGVTDTHDIIVDSTVSEATFAINWSNSSSDLDLTLKKPNGQVIDPTAAASDPNVDYVSGVTYEYYRVRTPTLVEGVWKMQITGGSISSVFRASAANGSGEPYTGLVTGRANLTLHTYLDRLSYLTYEPVRISVSLSDNQPITGASVTVTARQPSGNSTTITLYDDGVHDDGGADDGVYAQTYASTSTEGTYTFLAQASGTSNTGESFTREEEVSTYIAQSPHPPRQVYLPLILKNYPPDTTPPAAVTNLSTSNPTLNVIKLTDVFVSHRESLGFDPLLAGI